MEDPSITQQKRFFTWPVLACIALSLVVLWWFFYHIPGFGNHRVMSVLKWLSVHWNIPENEMEHAWLMPILSVVMLFHVRDQLTAAVKKIDWKGLILVLMGAGIYLIGYRIIQSRFCVVSIPVIVLGCIWFMAGFKTARICAIPILFLWLATPIPTLQQATVGLQIMATSLGQIGASLFGVDCYTQGTAIFSHAQKWDAYSVSGGCSGMRSLMALVMISIVWAYMSNLSLWKKLFLVACSVPLAVLGNAFRITSIVVLAEYIDPAFASKTWHDWSGLVLFFPITLAGLMLIHSLLAGEIPLIGKKRKTVVIRRNGSGQPPPQDQ